MKKKINLSQILAFALFTAVGGFAGYWMASTARAEFFLLDILIDFVLVVVCFMLQLIAHEAGHLLFGLLSGYRFCSFRIGSLMLVRLDGKLHLRRLSIAGTLGQCLLEPPELVNGRIPVIAYNLGGVYMNLIVSGICLLENCFLHSRVLTIGAVMGVILALSNGIPLRMGMVDNDGRNALSLDKNPVALRAFWIQLKCNAMLSYGVRLKDQPEEWFAKPIEQADNPLVATIAVLRCNRLMDAHEFRQADVEMAELVRMSSIPGIYSLMLQCDRLYCELIGENRPDVVQRMRTKQLMKFRKSMNTQPSIQRLAYAEALLLDRDQAKAADLRRRFEQIALSYPYQCEIASERELMDIAEVASGTKAE